jgi:hypothetical protein
MGPSLALCAAAACAAAPEQVRVASEVTAPPATLDRRSIVDCVVPPRTDLTAEKATADQYTASNFTTALQTLGLRTVVVRPSGLMIEKSGEVEGERPEGSILGPPYNRSTHRPEEGTPEFVLDGKDNLFIVERAPAVEFSKRYLLCGCSPGSGVAAQTVRNIYAVPPPYRYAGGMRVTYAARIIDVHLSGTNEQGQLCPQPP